jgi:hypothetical protein
VFSATIINADAGTHPVPSDPRALEASVRAGDICWHWFPYLSERYGERGHRFTRSDSAWLATLTRLDLPGATRQIAWLRGVLATRGIPSVLLQTHLEVLCDALDRAIPADHAAHATLRQAAEGLHEARRVRISDGQVTELSEAFDGATGAALRARLPRTPLLLVSAVVDEMDGSPGAVANLAGWLTDRQRFPVDWIAAVEAAIARACADATATAQQGRV